MNITTAFSSVSEPNTTNSFNFTLLHQFSTVTVTPG